MSDLDLRTEDRCMGECCEEIGVEVSPEELEASYRRWLRGDVLCRSEEEARRRATLWAEIWLIFPMLRFVRKGKNCEWGDQEVYIYTCTHFDSVSRKCLIYEYRPEMCRRHGKDHVCNNPRCRWKDAKRPPEVKKDPARLEEELEEETEEPGLPFPKNGSLLTDAMINGAKLRKKVEEIL